MKNQKQNNITINNFKRNTYEEACVNTLFGILSEFLLASLFMPMILMCLGLFGHLTMLLIIGSKYELTDCNVVVLILLSSLYYTIERAKFIHFFNYIKTFRNACCRLFFDLVSTSLFMAIITIPILSTGNPMSDTNCKIIMFLLFVCSILFRAIYENENENK